MVAGLRLVGVDRFLRSLGWVDVSLGGVVGVVVRRLGQIGCHNGAPFAIPARLDAVGSLVRGYVPGPTPSLRRPGTQAAGERLKVLPPCGDRLPPRSVAMRDGRLLWLLAPPHLLDRGPQAPTRILGRQ